MRRSADKFVAQTTQYAALSGQMLDRILALNGGTEYGRRCGLDGPSPRRAFERLPVTTYADYAPYVERLAAGERNLLSSQPVVYFATTSGTSGPQKMIPITRAHMREALRPKVIPVGLALRRGILRPMHGRTMVIMSEHSGGQTAGGIPKGAAISGGFQYFASLIDQFLTAPGEVIRVQDQAAARYLHMLFALRHERLWTIIAFFPAILLFALRDLQTYSEQLLRDLADGTINGQLQISEETRARLLQHLRPEPARARALATLVERGQFTIPNIWPDVTAILTATGGAFRFYIDQLRPYLGDLPIFSSVYSSCEGTVGVGFSTDQPYYMMTPGPAYIELLPVEAMGDPQARPMPAWQARPGCCYEVILTTLDGLTRYRLEDIVRVVEFYGQTPIIEFIERRGQVINLIGEKTAEHHVVEAMEAACRIVSTPLVDYFVVADSEHQPARYQLVIEGWPDGHDNSGEAQRLLQAFDVALRKAAPDYDTERRMGTLAPMSAILLRTGAFERERGRRIAAGASPSQIKTRHVVIDPCAVHQQIQDEMLFQIEAESGLR
jgi:hypothetical protein